MHKLLERLIRRHFSTEPPSEKMNNFFEALSDAFDSHDRDRNIIERSMTLMSDELNEANAKLSAQLSEVEESQLQLEKAIVEQSAIIDATPEAIINVRPDGVISQINKSGCDFFGMNENEIKLLSADLKYNLIAEKIKNKTSFEKLIKSIDENNFLKIRLQLQTKDNKYYECNTIPEIMNGQYIGRAWCFRDISSLKQNQKKLHRQAYSDALTGLPNRTSLISTIREAIAAAKKNQKKVAVIFIDLDDFKKINDTAGHDEGDNFLIDIANRVKSVLNVNDTFGRLGGDEFLIVKEDFSQLVNVLALYERLLRIFSNKFPIKGKEYVISFSAGVAVYPQDSNSADELIRKADMAMYQSKKNGKNTIVYFDPELERRAIDRVELEDQLRTAIAKKQFVLHFQPKVSLKTKDIIGVEALIRWKRPDGTLLYPDNFITLAEETGLIRDITRWVFEEVCIKLNKWKLTKLESIPISINVSAIDFADDNFIKEVPYLLEAYSIDASLLELELTESVFSEDIHVLQKTIKYFKTLGIVISIDDFGTGYSSLSYLHDLDLDYLKIDKSFIQSLQKSNKSQSITKSIISLGKNLNIKIIAEGIESEIEHNFLLDSGCAVGQGYYYGKPIEEKALIKLIDDTNFGNNNNIFKLN